ncbi:hypothetical protein [Chitinophaga cymbidii]|uniref:Uncharacterized protein n=1 Tax=Chitinophaga cymbidii TaxID=1096750 RepID=A0A512RFM5_9BACT|nr:hypothetical protein [Chitinophaga cymbidii]GEP94444.1 hypothetical protein CCY01nite_07040 [Chitinophaga cymbidii]
MDEIERIAFNNAGELFKGSVLHFKVNANNPSYHLLRVKEVVTEIARYDRDSWPSDEKWEDILPGWFIERIKSYDINEILSNSSVLWDYGSWLDAMKNRGWKWYSSNVFEGGFSIYLEAKEFPFSVNPLEYVIYESGVLLPNITFTEEF